MSSNPPPPNPPQNRRPQHRPPNNAWSQPPPGGGVATAPTPIPYQGHPAITSNPPPPPPGSSSLQAAAAGTNKQPIPTPQPPPNRNYQQPPPYAHQYAPYQNHGPPAPPAYHNQYYATHQSSTPDGHHAHPPPPSHQPPPVPYYQTHPQQRPYRGNQTPQPHVGMWRPTPAYHGHAPYGAPAGGPPSVARPVAREKKILNITDKSGNKIDLTQPKPEVKENEFAKQMREQAEKAIAENVGVRKKREEEERLKKEKEEREAAEREAKEKAEREAKEKAEREAREAREAKEKAEREAREKAEREAKEKAENEARQKALKEARDKALRDKAEKEAREKAARMAAAAQPPTPSPPPTQPTFRPGGSTTARLRPGGSSATLRPGGSSAALRPGGSALRPGGAAPSLRPGSSSATTLRPGGKKPLAPSGGGSTPSSSTSPSPTSQLRARRRVYTKSELLRYRDLCTTRPPDLRDMTIRVKKKQGDQWSRGSHVPRSQRYNNNNQNNDQHQQWNRGEKPPPPKGKRHSNNRGGRYDDDNAPVEKLKKSENRWVPTKNTSALMVVEKKVKSILNKMTKEKFDKLSNQMIDIQILSYEMLTVMIHNVYEKAIQEPSFGDMYADLCVRLAEKATSDEFIHLVESDEGEEGSTAYRWSNDVTTDDDEVVGPLSSVEECLTTAIGPQEEVEPVKRETELKLECLKIVEGVFVKVLKGEGGFYMVFFSVEKAEECGQQLSDIFGSEAKCKSDAAKQNSFKRTLLNKCEDEFNKQDIYVDWKKEKKEYNMKRSSLSSDERDGIEEELEFRRMKIKKQMLGNIKFIGELYKKSMIREHIMHYCIQSLLKLQKLDDGRIVNAKDDEMDEEDHEALCQLFTTIGKKIDTDKNQKFIKVYFKKIQTLSTDNKLPSRSRFMYRDLLELRVNNWKLRREKETAKTLDEIRKDAQRDEMKQERDRHQQASSHRSRAASSYGYGNYDRSQSSRRMNKPVETADGFTTVVKGRSYRQSMPAMPTPASIVSRAPPAKVTAPPPVAAAPPPPVVKTKAADPPDEEKIKHLIKNMRMEYLADPTNIEDLLYSVEKLSAAPDAGRSIVQMNADAIIDCRDAERPNIVKMLVLLFQKGTLTPTDCQDALSEYVEFIDSFSCDCPKAHVYMGDLVGQMIQVKAVSVPWLCESMTKLMDVKKDGVKLMAAVCETLGEDGVKSFAIPCEREIAKVLGEEGWNGIKAGMK